MKYKYEILQWFESKGKDTKNYNDYADLLEKINNENIHIIYSSNDIENNKESILSLVSTRWKHPIKLYFYENECYKIIGF